MFVKTALTFRNVTVIEHKSYVTAEDKSFHFALGEGVPSPGKHFKPRSQQDLGTQS